MKISPARRSAFDILYRIETEGAFSSTLLPTHEAHLSAKDSSLCHELTLGTLRKQILLDRTIDVLTKGRRLDAAVRVALRLGIYQLKFLDRVPAHSAVHESVNLVQRARKSSAKGLVNATLRNFQRAPINLTFADEIDELSVETSHPRWLLEKWIAQFGIEMAAGVAKANNVQGRLAFRFNGRGTVPASISGVEPSAVVDGCFLAGKAGTDLLEAAKNGTVYFQDEGSQLVGTTVRVRENERFLDVCAAPGSKTTQIAAKAADLREKLLVAGDFYWQRTIILRGNCQRQGVGFVNVIQYNGETSLPFADESFDVVLVDAPCSGTGTIRSNPEIRYFLNPADFAELSLKQLRILTNASKTVRRGGRLIYSTCSLETEENEAVAEKFSEQSGQFKPVVPDVPTRFITDKGFARTSPGRDGMDGFFISAFDRAP